MSYYCGVELDFIFKPDAPENLINELKKDIESKKEYNPDCTVTIEKKKTCDSFYTEPDVFNYFVSGMYGDSKEWYNLGDFIRKYAPYIESFVLGKFYTEDCADGFTYIMNPFQEQLIIKSIEAIKKMGHRDFPWGYA